MGPFDGRISAADAHRRAKKLLAAGHTLMCGVETATSVYQPERTYERLVTLVVAPDGTPVEQYRRTADGRAKVARVVSAKTSPDRPATCDGD